MVNFRNHSSELLSSYLRINNIDISFFSPSGLQEFVSYVKSHDPRLDMGDKILIMGEPVPLGLKKETRDLLSVDIIESWGNSEGLGTITEANAVEIRPNSIGRPFLCDDNFIVDENNNKLPDNEIGRIAGKTNCAFSGYSQTSHPAASSGACSRCSSAIRILTNSSVRGRPFFWDSLCLNIIANYV